MKNDLLFWLRESRAYTPALLVVLLVNAMVPALSRLGTTEGALDFWQMTYWVNVFALIALIPLALFTKKQKKYKSFRVRDIAKISSFALVWPFAFSFLYFGSVEIGSATLTTIISRLSIFVYLLIRVCFYKEKDKFDWKDLALMVCMIMAIILAYVTDLNDFSWRGLIVPALMVVGVAITTGTYRSVIEQWKNKYDSLETVLWLEIAMVVYSTLLLLLIKHPFFPVETLREGGFAVLGALWKPAAIGIAANAFGFWASLQGQQSAANLSDFSHKVFFLVVTTGVVTFIQIIVISMITSEVVTAYQWLASVLLAVGLIVHRFLKSEVVKKIVKKVSCFTTHLEDNP